MKYSTFVYGTGIVFGATIDFTEVVNATGPSTGGSAIVIRGEGFDYTSFDDDFTGVILDVAKWTDESIVTGSISTGVDHLKLATGATAGSIAGISMDTTYANTQYECRVNIPRPITYPLSVVSLFVVRLYVDANNYADMSVRLNSDKTIELVIEITNSGAIVESYSIDWTIGVSTFKILNWMDYTYFYANGSLISRSNRFIVGMDKWYFFADNKGASYNVANTIVEYVNIKPFILIDDEPIHDSVVVSDYRIRGVTPPSIDVYGTSGAYAGLADVTVVAGTTYTDVDAYTYYYVDELIALDESSITTRVNLIGDSTIRTPSTSSRGLGKGV